MSIIGLTPVQNSKAIGAYGYDAAQRVLRVQFAGGKIHDYLDVDAKDAAGMDTAESIGRYVSTVIKPAYESTPVESAAEEG